MGAYDNLLLGSLYRALYGAPFAAGADGVALSGSATAETLRAAFGAVRSREALARLAGVFARSRRALARLAAHEGIRVDVPRVVPAGRAASARLEDAARRLLEPRRAARRAPRSVRGEKPRDPPGAPARSANERRRRACERPAGRTARATGRETPGVSGTRTRGPSG